MAILCIRVAPNNHPTDPRLDVLRTQVDDVVCVVEDGHVFSNCELKCGQYRFVSVPGVPSEDLVHLTTPAYDADGAIAKVRTKALDTSSLKASATKAQLDALTVAKV